MTPTIQSENLIFMPELTKYQQIIMAELKVNSWALTLKYWSLTHCHKIQHITSYYKDKEELSFRF